jgi:hypothetical protein
MLPSKYALNVRVIAQEAGVIKNIPGWSVGSTLIADDTDAAYICCCIKTDGFTVEVKTAEGKQWCLRPISAAGIGHTFVVLP